MDAGRTNHITPTQRIDWGRAGPWLLGLAIVLGVVLGPTWLSSYGAGLLNSTMIWLLLSAWAIMAWKAMLVVAGVQVVRHLSAAHRMVAVLWLGAALGILLALNMFLTKKTLSPHLLFGHGLITRLEIQTNVDGIQTWVESLNPRDWRGDPHIDGGRFISLTKENQPKLLRRQTGFVRVEPDAAGRPRVHLMWYRRNVGTWGLVIGRRDMNTPASEPDVHGEKRTELRPSIYFWFVHA